MKDILTASCRVAFSALIHDIGKFAQRAQLFQTDDINKQLYCPENEYGFTHIHSAYTALAIDKLEACFPPIRSDDMFPFKGLEDKNIDDSLINGASKHHKPETFLQHIITQADRLSSAFERSSYEIYNKTTDDKNYISSRLVSLFDELDKTNINDSDLTYRYPLKALSCESIFPIPYKELTTQQAIDEYKSLWQEFEKDLKKIPTESKSDWRLWLDHFDSLWQTYTWAVPSASAFVKSGYVNKTISDVSLYDHSKSTASLATALWRYYCETYPQSDDKEYIQLLKKEDEEPFLIIQGDMSGIQNFIFTQGGSTQSKGSKLLRGRSFFVSLLCECAALKILDELSLPSTSQVINAAGHFLIVAPNTKETIQKLTEIKKEFNDWFLKSLYGVTHIALSWQSASSNDFTQERFPQLQKKLHEELEKAKHQTLNILSFEYQPVFLNFLKELDEGDICQADGCFPANKNSSNCFCSLCEDILNVGTDLTKRKYLKIGNIKNSSVKTDIFGYQIDLSDDPALLKDDKYQCIWDMTLPQRIDSVLFNGYARRNINAYVPKNENNEVITFEEIAFNSEGKKALMTLKGDIDNLGFLFQERLKKKTFATYAGMSRQINTFFAVYLPYLCYDKYEYIYTIFAGGDDFFFIGPWNNQLSYLEDIYRQFRLYTCQNITFSAGLVMSHETTPVRTMAELTEESLDESKSVPNKNAVTCFGKTLSFDEFLLMRRKEDNLNYLAQEYKLSTGFIYRLIYLTEKAQSSKTNPQDAIWRSWFQYRLIRHLKDCGISDESDDKLTRGQGEISAEIGASIDKYTEKYKVALFPFLYRNRREEEEYGRD